MGRWVQAGLVNLNLEGFLRSPPIAGLPTARLAFSVRIIRMFPSWRGVAQDGCQRFSGSWGVHRRKLFTSIGQKPFSRSRSQEAFDLISLHVVLQVIRHQDSLCQGELPGNREKQNYAVNWKHLSWVTHCQAKFHHSKLSGWHCGIFAAAWCWGRCGPGWH